MNLNPSTTVDFAQIVRALRVRGMSRNSIASTVSCPRQSIDHYANGTTPLHPVGERLIALWCQFLGKQREEIPLRFESIPPNASQSSTRNNYCVDDKLKTG
jgi:hypothetical protein